jgi:hypothetical protein
MSRSSAIGTNSRQNSVENNGAPGDRNIERGRASKIRS